LLTGDDFKLPAASPHGICGEDYLHHGSVTSYDRAEDAKTVTRTKVEAGMAASNIVPNSDDNPSDRRDGIVIEFWCELCTAHPIELRIAQHKGNTHVSWKYTTHPELPLN
jgi:hypothetical protein